MSLFRGVGTPSEAGRAATAQQNAYFDANDAAQAARGSPPRGERNKIRVLMRRRGGEAMPEIASGRGPTEHRPQRRSGASRER